LARTVGLDVGASRVRLLEAEGGAKGIRVLRLGERELVLPEGTDREEAVREAVDALFRETRASRDEVVLAWPAEGCTIREISVPFREADQIRKVAKFEFESHLHSQSIDEVVLDHAPLGESKEGTRLLCFAAPKAPLRARLRTLQAARVDPVAVDVDVGALAAAAAATGVLAETPTCALLDVGERSTKIVLVVEGRVRAARAFRTGADEAEPPPPPPGTAAAEASPGGGTAVAVARGDVLTRLAREVSRTLANAAPGIPVPCAWVAGRGSIDPDRRAGLAERLGMEVRPLDLFARVTSPVPPESAGETSALYAGAFGAAARGLGLGPLAVDLRREDLGYARRFDQVKGPLAAALAFLLLGMGFLLWRAKNEKEAAHKEFLDMVAVFQHDSKRVEEAFRKQLPEEAQKLRAAPEDPLRTLPEARARVVRMHDHLRNTMGLSTEVPAIRSGLVVFKLVNDALRGVREQLEYCLITNETYSQREVEFQVDLSRPEDVDVIKSALEAIRGPDGNPLFNGPKKVEYTTVKQGSKGKYSVPFICRFEEK
jgi:hypothetical protein